MLAARKIEKDPDETRLHDHHTLNNSCVATGNSSHRNRKASKLPNEHRAPPALENQVAKNSTTFACQLKEKEAIQETSKIHDKVGVYTKHLLVQRFSEKVCMLQFRRHVNYLQFLPCNTLPNEVGGEYRCA